MRRHIPNCISFLRLLSVPVLMWLILEDRFTIAFWLFIAAGISDSLDGWLAKKLDAHSEFGAALDPVADKVMLIALFLVFWISGELPRWLVFLVVSRDLVIMIAMLAALTLGHTMNARPNGLSKANTGLQLVLLGLILGEHGAGIPDVGIVYWLGYIVGITTLWSGLMYLRDWNLHMKSEATS